MLWYDSHSPDISCRNRMVWSDNVSCGVPSMLAGGRPSCILYKASVSWGHIVCIHIDLLDRGSSPLLISLSLSLEGILWPQVQNHHYNYRKYPNSIICVYAYAIHYTLSKRTIPYSPASSASKAHTAGSVVFFIDISHIPIARGSC